MSKPSFKLLPLPYPEVFRILCQHGSIVMPLGVQFPFSRKVLDKAGHVVGCLIGAVADAFFYMVFRYLGFI